MQTNPDLFNHLKLLFGSTSQASHTEDIIIRIDNIVGKSQMVQNLLQQFDQDTQDVFLTANDEKRLLTETTINILIETIEDMDVVSSISELEIYNKLKEILISGTINEQSPETWKSVLWNDENYRPDKIADTLNRIFKKLDNETHRNMSELYQNYDIVQNEGVASFREFISTTASAKTDFSRHGCTSTDDLEKFYQESKNHVEWDGDQFLPKSLTLSKINSTQLRDKQSLQDCSVRVRFSTAVLSIAINFVQHADLTITDEWQNLNVRLASLSRELNGNKF